MIKGDLRVKDIESLVAQSIDFMYKNDLGRCIQNVKEMLVWYKEEIEKREGDRERQLRRLRRETARFSSTAGMMPSAREQEAQSRGSYFDYTGIGTGAEDSPMMGRGERSKKKRRFRSLSPVAKAQTPDGGSSAGAGWGGEANRLQNTRGRIGGVSTV